MVEGKITVWCLLGKKAGDNTQVRALADELGLGYEEKHIAARSWELLCHLGSGVTLAGIDRAASSELEAPWPDLVITAGRRNEPVARWIQRQSRGNTRLVHIGRPWAPLASWDLVVTTPQYFLPRQDNILHNTLPLQRMAREDLEPAGALLRPALADLPRPWIAVLVGGDSGRFVMTPEKGEQLGRLSQELAAASGGSLLVTDSARTPHAAGDALQAQLSGPHFCYRWHGGEDNPYRSLLALADAFVVTGESMSMLGEAAGTGKPLYIFDMGEGCSTLVDKIPQLPLQAIEPPFCHGARAASHASGRGQDTGWTGGLGQGPVATAGRGDRGGKSAALRGTVARGRRRYGTG